MPAQLVVRISDELDEALDTLARRMIRKRSELVRMALEQFVKAVGSTDQGMVREESAKYLGSLHSGLPDLATQHRTYLMDILRRAR